MIRSLRAIVWLRWRLLLNAIRGGRRRDAMEQISRAFAALTPLAFFALSFGTVVAMGVLGYLGGRALATGLLETDLVVLVARVVLFAALALVVIVTVVSPAQTTLSKYARLLLLPIRRQTLHVTEVAANLLDPWILFAVPAVVLFAAGLAAGGAPGVAAVAAAAGAGLLVVLAALGAFVSSLVGWLVRSRRRGEMFTLVFVLAVSLVSFLPAMLSERLDRRRGDRDRQTATIADFNRRLPAWTRALPSELYGHAVTEGARRRTLPAWVAVAGLWGQALVLFAASSAAHRKLVESVEGEGRRRRTPAAAGRNWRLPLAGPAVSAIAITEYRSAMRSVRGRLAVLLPGPLVAILAVLVRTMPEDPRWLEATLSQGHLVLAAGLVFALYSLQPFTMNLFGVDRGGLTRLLLAPISEVELARGKIAGCGLTFATAGALAFVVALVVAPNGPVAYWLAIVLGAVATYAWLAPAAVWLSALFPVPADMSKTGSGGNPHPLLMFGSTVLVLVLAAPVAGAFLLNWLWIHRPGAVLALMIVWAVASVVCAVPLVGLAARAIRLRRENLALVAERR